MVSRGVEIKDSILGPTIEDILFNNGVGDFRLSLKKRLNMMIGKIIHFYYYLERWDIN